MIELVETDDMFRVKLIVSDQDIWERFSDGVDAGDYQPSNTETEQWLLVEKLNTDIGIIHVVCKSTCSVEIHPYLLNKEKVHGREMMRLFYKWFLSSMPKQFVKINVNIPECFKTTINFAVKVGFVKEGFIRDSYIRNSKLFGKIAMGITREEVELWVA